MYMYIQKSDMYIQLYHAYIHMYSLQAKDLRPNYRPLRGGLIIKVYTGIPNDKSQVALY